MRKIIAIAALAVAGISAQASAQDAPATTAAVTAKVGQLVVSSDNKRIGRIDRVEATRVGVIYDMKYVYIPVATLSAGEGGRVVTSLARKDIGR